MTDAFQQRAAALADRLTPDERANAIAYLAEPAAAAGTRLTLPGVDLTPPEEAWVAFVDQDPGANWGHPARYLLLARRGGAELLSVPARLPPFGAGAFLRWRLAYRGPSAPPAAAATP